MNFTEKTLAADLDSLATTIELALTKLQALASQPAHVIRHKADFLNAVWVGAPKLTTALRGLAEHIETASCEAVVFPNTRCGLESVVRPAVGGYSVVVRDTDADRTLPTVHRFISRDEAIAKAKHFAGIC